MVVSFIKTLTGTGEGGVSLSEFLPISNAVTAPMTGITASQVLSALDAQPGYQLSLERLWSYYENEQYSEDSLEARGLESAERMTSRATSQLQTLYAFIRSFFNPVTQVVDMDVDSVFGSDGVSFDVKDDSADNEGRQATLDDILDRSYFAEEIVNVTRCALVTGDAYLRIVPDIPAGEVRIYYYTSELARVVYNPHNKNEIIGAFVSYDYNEIVQNDVGEAYHETHNRTDVYTFDYVRTFRDGELYSFDGNPPEYENILGEVPFVHLKNQDTGLTHGISTFNHVVATLDAVNEVFAFLVNIIKMNADPPVIAEGVQPDNLEKGDATDSLASTVFFINGTEGKSGNSMYLLEWKGNLPDVMGVLKQVKDDVIDLLPEMHVSKMQQQGAYSGQALNAMMFAFVRKIGRMRQYYRSRVGQAFSMALAAQAMMDGERTDFDWRDPKYKVEIKFPSILPVDEDALVNRVMTKMKAGLLGGKQALTELGYPADEIDAVLSEAKSWQDTQAQLQIKVAKASRPIPGGPGGPPNGPPSVTKGGAGGNSATKQAAKAVNKQPVNKQLAS